MLSSRAVDLLIPDARVVRMIEGRISPMAISFRPAEREAQRGVVLKTLAGMLEYPLLTG